MYYPLCTTNFSAPVSILHLIRCERKVLEQYGDTLDTTELWELAAGEQLQSYGLSESLAYVTRNEFCLAMLIRMEKIGVRDLQACQRAFDRLDVTNNGKLTMNDIRERRASSIYGASPTLRAPSVQTSTRPSGGSCSWPPRPTATPGERPALDLVLEDEEES